MKYRSKTAGVILINEAAASIKAEINILPFRSKINASRHRSRTR